MNPLIDVVVVNHRTPELALACIDSLRRYLHVPYELYLVDNSPEGEQMCGAEVIPNAGYGNAVNHGVSLGSAPLVLILNADVEMTSQSHIQGMLDLIWDPAIAVVGPKQINRENLITSAGCPPVPTVHGYVIRGWMERDRGQYRERCLDCMYVSGSIVLTRRKVFEELGGFLETPLYYEETFYCYKARHRGYRVVYTGESVWIHHWDSSPKEQKHLTSGRSVALVSHAMFVEACKAEGMVDIPPFA